MRKLALPLTMLCACACAPGEDPPPSGPVCTEPDEVACKSELTSALDLVTATVSPQGIANERDGDGLKSIVDARAGGLTADPRQPFLYARFTPQGLAKVDVDDEAALTSMEWDIAFHRYIVRLNGGSSGPSCVSAAALEGEDYDDVVMSPAANAFATDRQMTSSCAFRADAEAADPANERDFGVALRDWYSYVGCVKTTMTPFVVRLADRSHVKLVLTHFYDDAAQAECNREESNTPTGAGLVQLRWAFLEDA